MPKYRWITGVCVVLMLGASTASAQDASAAGLTLSSNAIGIHVPAGDRAAIRPTLGFSRNTSDYEGSQFIEDSITTTTLVPGVAVLLYLKSWDDTRLYVSPQYTYSRLSSNIDGTNPGTRTVAHSWSVPSTDWEHDLDCLLKVDSAGRAAKAPRQATHCRRR